jgi:DNA polymerase III alpha subunit (gram-positive type)
MTIIDLNQTRETIDQLLEAERTDTSTGREAIETRKKRRVEIKTHINEIRSAYYQFDMQHTSLPALPNIDLMDWADDVLSMLNLAIVVIDTTSLNEHADILRIYAIDDKGEELLDVIVKPQRELDPNTTYTGISQEQMEQARTLEEKWGVIQFALSGCFWIAYNLEFLEDRLKDNIEHYQLSRLPFMAGDLMYQARSYFSIGNYGYKLADVAARIGYTLPFPALAPDRAKAMLALLNAMAQGVTSAPKTAEITVDTELAAIEDHPF